MGNVLTDRVIIGTMGELLVQTRLLQYGVQAAPPIRDSGNDLIAVKGEAFRGVQVKTTTGTRISRVCLPAHYHIVALVYLEVIDGDVLLDQSDIFLVPRDVVDQNYGRLPADLELFQISQPHVDGLFQQSLQ
ncbi:hypothetical protein H3005_12510 [Stenotrophomonas sp. Br8]|uniref:hypothetical protein n=1 Tax=Stenotrophomonas sp. Br8 TaxID=2759658 RepID=UPI00168BD571|nr:hypothetical protein [Stenotrophomonas sp. Br8]MBD3682683.1 hypothetical protein [Stenotrophomonas sp. Br8]